MDKEIQAKAREAIVHKVFPGCVIGIVEKSGERLILPFGTTIYDSRENVTEHTVYDLASVTKSIPVASLAAIAIEKGVLSLSDLVRMHIPELRNDHAATIKDLLLYRVHGPRMSDLKHRTFEEIRTSVFESGFTDHPGESAYSNIPAFLIGIVLERTLGKPLPALGEEYFFGPLGMTRTTFFPAASDCAPTEIDERGEVRGMPHDESTYVFAQARRAVGHAGLFSTAPDMLQFIEAILVDRYPAVRVAAEQGLGWQLNQKFFMGNRFGPRTFGKTGFTGTSICIDCDRGVGFVILSNRIYPKRPVDCFSLESAINRFRSEIASLILG